MLGSTALFCSVVLGADWATAVPSATFDIGTFKDFNAGTPKGALIRSDGAVVTGFGLTKLKLKQKDGTLGSMIWSRARAADGTLYLGTGQPGQILALRNGTISVVADLKTVLVSALEIGPGGKLLAATLPGARVLQVDPRSGAFKELSKLPAKHVWDLLYDAKAKRIYAATGAPGNVFTIPTGGGKPAVYYAPKEKHLLTLALDAKRNLLTGGTEKAILYRITAKNRATAIHDFAANELRRVVIGADGTIFVAVNKFRARTSGIPRYDRDKGKSGTKISGKSRKGTRSGKFRASELRPGAKSGKGSVFRIDTDGRVDELHSLKKGYFTDLSIDQLGRLWAAEGTRGKVFLIAGRRVMTVADVDQRQALVLAMDREPSYLATGDAAAIYQLKPRPAGKAEYWTKVLDAKTPGRWGNVSYYAKGKLQLASRSGNTAKPDATWTPFRPLKRLDKSLGRVTSPSARYLQLRVQLADSKAALHSIKAYYRPQNREARIKKLEIKRDKKKNAILELKWKIENPDKDEIVYHLAYREELGVTWRPLNEGKPVEKEKFEWDTSTVAADTYRLRIIASDERANGPATTRKHTHITPPIIIDNRKPDLIGIKVRYPFVTGLAKDEHTPISGVSYSVDGGPWRLLDAVDGIYDSKAETFRFALPAIKRRGTHTLAIQAKDAAGNKGIRQVRFVR
jgi:hypothetical protein